MTEKITPPVRGSKFAADSFCRRLDEYAPLLNQYDLDRDSECLALVNQLRSEYDWTQAGAEELLGVVKKYGAFFLMNATALAVALEVEDGESGF